MNHEIQLPLFEEDDRAEYGHVHEYKTYYGLKEAFQYCIHCDRKRDLPVDVPTPEDII